MDAEVKKKFRKKIHQRLESIPFDKMIRKSQDLRDNFEKHFLSPYRELVKNKFIVSFYPFSNEPQINLENYELNIGYVRVTDWDHRKMEAAQARRDLPGQWIDISPQPDIQIFQPTDAQPLLIAEQIGVILVPALAFSHEGKRLGRGKGFYDQYLKQVPDALRLGVAFQEQLSEEITEEAWDERVDAILTDHEWIETPRFSSWKNRGIVER